MLPAQPAERRSNQVGPALVERLRGSPDKCNHTVLSDSVADRFISLQDIFPGR